MSNKHSPTGRLQKVSTNHSITSLSLSSDNFERLLQYQPNYIKRLFNEVVESNPFNAHIIIDYIIAEEAETNIQESTNACCLDFFAIINAFLR